MWRNVPQLGLHYPGTTFINCTGKRAYRGSYDPYLYDILKTISGRALHQYSVVSRVALDIPLERRIYHGVPARNA